MSIVVFIELILSKFFYFNSKNKKIKSFYLNLLDYNYCYIIMI